MSVKNKKLSYSSCPMAEPYIYQSLPERLRMLAEEDPEREAFVFYNYEKERKALTRAQVFDDSTALAKRFVHLGLKKGNNVAFCMKNSLEMIICNMAVVIAGGIPFFLSSTVKDGSDNIVTMRQMQAVILITDACEGDSNWKFLDQICPLGKDKSTEIPSLNYIIFNGYSSINSTNRVSLNCIRTTNIPGDIEFPDVHPEDILLYFCTSGSTGQPKTVTITHFSLFNWTKQANKAFGITKNSRFFNERTFSWIFGYPRTYLTEGATRICVDPRISLSGQHVEFVCDVIEKEHCDVTFIPGYITSDLKSRLDLSSP